MRLRVGVLLCLFLVILGAGCRKALSPNIDNIAPETWITAAPQDTITDRPAVGPPQPGRPGEIPVRYHLYWAGSDADGAVTGFYWAVVETLPVPPADGLGVPSLPGPKPQDYRFTTRTDSIFIFHASEDVPVREHAFFLYAVDDKGRSDATPARFMFRAYDRFPPLAVIDSCYAEGAYYLLNAGGGVTRQIRTYMITDSFDVARPYPRDTVPSGSRLEFRWHGEATIPSTLVTGFRYKLDEPEYNVGDSTVRSATYNTRIGADVVAPGIKKFTLRAVGESGWRGEATRYFQMNFAPTSWFTGPDVNDFAQAWQTYSDGNGRPYYYKNITWSTFSTPGSPGIPNTLLSPDSVNVLPASRSQKRSFFEFYQNRIWAHAEYDTVNLNSWVLIPAGGYDPDSPYLVKVGLDPGMPIGIVTTPDPNPNGSPIGFRANITVRKLDGGSVRPTETNTFPIFDITSSYHEPKISYRGAMAASGKAYAYVVAEDGDGTVDRRLQQAGGAEAVVEAVDGGGGTAEQLAARALVMVFYVNHAPRLDVNAAGFFPKPNVSVIHGVNQTFTLLAHDIDPIDETRTVDRVGGPQSPPAPVLVKTVDLIQDQGGGVIVTQRVCEEFEAQNPNFTPLSTFINGPMTVRVELSDGRKLASERFGRRTVVTDIPVTYSVTAPGGTSTGVNQNSSQSTQRPGSPQDVNGRQ